DLGYTYDANRNVKSRESTYFVGSQPLMGSQTSTALQAAALDHTFGSMQAPNPNLRVFRHIYNYDSLDRLTDWSVQDQNVPIQTMQQYTYNGVGNLINET